MRQFSKHKYAIMYVFFILILIVLAYWVSGQLIEHLDQKIREMGDLVKRLATEQFEKL